MKRALVMGLARTGAAVTSALVAEGWHVVVVDRDDGERVRARAASLPPGVEVHLGAYPDDVAAGSDLVSPSPGVPWDAPALRWAREHGVAVHSEIDLVLQRCRSRIIGVTGTNGKTTTTALVAAILRRAHAHVLLGGNIGRPVIDRLEGFSGDGWVVLELSSFQLETVPEPRVSIACVLNVTPDHLDRHGTFENYVAIKERLVRFAQDNVVLGHDDPVTRAMAASASCPVRFFGADIEDRDGTTVRDGDVVSVEGGRTVSVLPVSSNPLFGAHNVLNVLAAVAATRAAGVQTEQIAEAVSGFHAVPHRLETVLDAGGVVWVNDSKATNVASATVGLRAFDRPIVWIGGGSEQGAPVDELAHEVATHVRYAVLNGESAGVLDAALARRGFDARTTVATVRDAVALARDLARPGDVVLFSPGFKSFDQFDDFEHRGDIFRELVRAMTPVEVTPR